MEPALNPMSTDFHTHELDSAIAADHAAKCEAMSRGALATQPLTLSRLVELAELGEKMMATNMRKNAALAAADAWARRDPIDIVLPSPPQVDVVQIEIRDRWVYVRLPPKMSSGTALSAIAAAPRMNGGNLILDASALGISDTAAHAIIGDELARTLKPRRLALVVPEDILSYNSERAAQRVGLNLRTFTSLDEAEKWVVA